MRPFKLITNTLFLTLLAASVVLSPSPVAAWGKKSEANKAGPGSEEAAAVKSSQKSSELTGKSDSSGGSQPEKAEKSEKAEKPEKSIKAAKSIKATKDQKVEKSEEEAEDGDHGAEKGKKKKKKDEPSEEELAAEKAYKEYQDNLNNSLKQVKTPFSQQEKASTPGETDGSLTLTLPRAHRSLQDRLLASRLYLPGRLVLGKPAQFTIKGRPGWWAALAMADRNSGAKPVLGQNLRLGPDRKVVALGKIPESGVLALNAYCPIAGDLVGSNLYFEAAVWPEGGLDRAEIAQTISSESQAASGNAILVAEETEKKKGVRIVPDGSVPIYQRVTTGATTLDSGKP